MGFKLRSGNGPLAFKNMGSSPAKQGFTIPGADGGTSAIDAFTTKTKNKEIVAPEVKKAGKDKVRVMTEKESKMKQDGKLGTVFSRTAKKVGKSIKKGANKVGKSFKEAVKNPQAMRDMGEIISNIGDPNKSMTSIIQGQADRKVANKDKITARKDKDIENANMVANTKRTNQRIAQATADLEAGDGELPNTEVEKKGGGTVTTGLKKE
tara:strand:- start:397 stop:1023 length:627 start_codon:yes stop_codon:yes gene_type:complete